MPTAVLALLLAAPPGPPTFAAHTAAGDLAPAAVEAVGPDLAVRFSAGPGVPAGQLLTLARAGVERPGWPAGPHVVLTNGDRVAGRVAGGDARVVRFFPALVPDADPWPVPVAAVAAVWVQAPPADLVDPARPAWAAPKADALCLRTGDVRTGTVEAFTADPPGVRLKPAGKGAEVVPLADLAAAALDPTLARPRKLKGTAVRATFTDGSRVTLTAVEVADGTLTGTTAFAAKLVVPLDRVVALDVLGGKLVDLSDLTPVESEVAGFTGAGWPWTRDRAVTGGPLRLPGAGTLDRGVGTHALTRLTFAVPDGAAAFTSLVGLDPVAGRRGTADVSVLVDGRPAASPGRLTFVSGAVPVRVPLAGAKRLTLVVDYGPAGGVQAAVNWGLPRVVLE